MEKRIRAGGLKLFWCSINNLPISYHLAAHLLGLVLDSASLFDRLSVLISHGSGKEAGKLKGAIDS